MAPRARTAALLAVLLGCDAAPVAVGAPVVEAPVTPPADVVRGELRPATAAERDVLIRTLDRHDGGPMVRTLRSLGDRRVTLAYDAAIDPAGEVTHHHVVWLAEPGLVETELHGRVLDFVRVFVPEGVRRKERALPPPDDRTTLRTWDLTAPGLEPGVAVIARRGSLIQELILFPAPADAELLQRLDASFERSAALPWTSMARG